MKSKASMKGHPFHPILVAFPIAFFTGTLVFDVLDMIYSKAGFWQTAKYLNIGGIVFALIAAIPGIIDYFYTVPPESSAKKRATWHGSINLSVVIIFSISLYLKQDLLNSNLLIISMESAGFILLGIAGYMGGTLVFRNQIGVYNRYANKGLWQEVHLKEQKGKMEIPMANKLETDQMLLVHIGDTRIVIAKSEKGYVAFDDRCTHKGASLAGGVMICDTVQCPWHGSQFNVKTGAVEAGPARGKIKVYKISEEAGKVFLEL